MGTFKNINGMEVYFHPPEEVNIPAGVRYIDEWNWCIFDLETDEYIFPDGTKIPTIPITDDTPEWKAMLEWAEEYIKVLEWKAKA